MIGWIPPHFWFSRCCFMTTDESTLRSLVTTAAHASSADDSRPRTLRGRSWEYADGGGKRSDEREDSGEDEGEGDDEDEDEDESDDDDEDEDEDEGDVGGTAEGRNDGEK